MEMITAPMKYQATMDAASAAKDQGKVEAQQEEIAATQRESDRKERLAEAMASQTASAGARGVFAFEGSPLAVLNEDIRKEEVATDRDSFNARVAGLGATIRGSNRSSQLKTQARIGLLTDVQSGLKTAGAAMAGGG